MKTLLYLLHPENFHREVIEEERPVLLLCMPDDDRFPEQLKVVEEFAESHISWLKVALIQEDFIDVFKTDYSVTGTPTFLFLIKGREIGRLLGMADREMLAGLIEGWEEKSFADPRDPEKFRYENSSEERP